MLLSDFSSAAKPSTQARAAAEKQKLEAVQAQIKKLSEDQKKLEEQRADANKSVQEMDAKVAQASKMARKSNQQLLAQQSQLELLEKDQQALEAKLVKQKQVLAAIIRSAYALGKTPNLELVLSQDKLSDSSRALAYHHYFQLDQKVQLDAVSLQLQELSAMTEKVERQQQRLLKRQPSRNRRLLGLPQDRAKHPERRVRVRLQQHA